MLEYDVVIVGGRIAGSSLALLLGERGHRVLLVDRDRFPSDTLSTHYMSPLAVPLLAQIGILADVEAAGFRRLTRSRAYIEDCVLEGPHAPRGGYALAPRRDVLDAIAVEHAIRRGHVEFHDRTVAQGLLWEDGHVVGVSLRSGQGERVETRAKVVVGADGKYSSVAEWVEAPKYHEVPPLRPGYYGYFHGVAPLAEAALEIFYQSNVIGFVFPMRPNEDCLALELQPEHWTSFRANPLETFLEWFRTLSGMTSRLANARIEGKLLGFRGNPNFFRKPYGPGWVLTGDAAYCKDPSTGIGLNDAISQALWLSEALHESLNGADWEETMSSYQRKRDEAMLPWYQLTLNYTRAVDTSPDAVAWLRAVCCNPGLVRSFASGIPTALANPDIFPVDAFPRVARLAEGFGAAPPETKND